MAKKQEHQYLTVVDKNNNPVDIPLEGSLGLLAAGYKGVMVWRAKRKEHLDKILQSKITEEKNQQ